MTPKRLPRISGRPLQRIRRAHFQERPLCVNLVGHRDVRVATELDHVVPLHKGGADTTDPFENRQGLCEECHGWKSRRDLGWMEKPEIGIDGWPVEKKR